MCYTRASVLVINIKDYVNSSVLRIVTEFILVANRRKYLTINIIENEWLINILVRQNDFVERSSHGTGDTPGNTLNK